MNHWGFSFLLLLLLCDSHSVPTSAALVTCSGLEGLERLGEGGAGGGGAAGRGAGAAGGGGGGGGAGGGRRVSAFYQGCLDDPQRAVSLVRKLSTSSPLNQSSNASRKINKT